MYRWGVVVLAVACLLGTAALTPAATAQVVQNANDDLRTGWYPGEGRLTREIVTGGSFGQQFSAAVDGQVYAQPILAGGNLLVATENNNVYALDPGTGAQRWTKNLGSAAPVGLPDSFGTAKHPHLLVQSGKQGFVYLLDRDDLGGTGQGANGGDAVVQRLGPDGGLWGKPAVWPGDGGWVYTAPANGGNSPVATGGNLHAYRAGVNGAGDPTLTLAGSSADAFGLSSSSPIVTSDGTANGSAVVWVVYAPNSDGKGAQLRAYDPVPAGGRMTLLGSWPIGTAAKFNPPVADGGHVYVGTRDGHVLSFGSPMTTPLTGGAVSFGTAAVGTGVVRTATLTAQTAVTVNRITPTAAAFTAGTPSPALPARLAAGQQLTVPVTFTPTTTGRQGGSLQIATDLGDVTAALDGTGLSATAQLSATPTVISFGGAAIGTTATQGATFTNTGAQPLTVNSVTPPKPPFGVSGLPAGGFTLAAGASFTVTASFAPTAGGSFTDELTLATTGGDVTVPLSGSAATPPRMTLTPAALDFGTVPVGATATRTFTLANTGGSPLAVTKSKPPITDAGFVATSDLAEGTTVPAGGKLTGTVTFTPAKAGAVSDGWVITGDDGSGVQTVQLTGTGATAATVPAPTATNGWTKNGAATFPTGGGVQLTRATSFAAGSSWWPQPVGAGYLDVTFDAYLGDGVGGADGLTLALQPATGAKATALGGRSGGLGWAGTKGVAVALDTFKNDKDPGDNFAGIATGPYPGKTVGLAYGVTNATVPKLRGATRHVHVHLEGGTLTADIDGTRALTTAATGLGPAVLLGFTGATGGFTDKHLVTNVRVTAVQP